ncbi:MAG: glycosyltransferase family 4 protein [Treponema sp.]|nr:glycosyltransferase family 4 protein [Treponema sp.]
MKDNNMKVCFIADNSIEITGGAQSLLALILSLKKYDVEPVILGHKDSEQLHEANRLGIKTKIIKTKNLIYPTSSNAIIIALKNPVKKIYNFFKRKEIKKFYIKENIEFVHLNSIRASIECAVIAYKLNIPYVWHIREYLDKDQSSYIKDFRFYNKYLQKAKYIITISRDIQAYWSNKLKRECVLIYNGFDVDKYYLDATKKLLSEQLNCIMVGRFAEGKRQIDAVKAIEILIQNGIKNVTLTIVGYRERFMYDKKIKEYIDSHNLNSFINLIDFTYDLKSIYEKNDIGLMCSTREAFGRVTIEYMLSGLLCIGSNTGGTLELIDDGNTGILYDMGKPEILAEKLEWVMNHKDECKEILLNGQKNAIEKFSIERTAAKVINIYKEFIHQ